MPDLEDALRRVQQGAPEDAHGLSNHGPMAAEALIELGHPALIPAFVDRDSPRFHAFACGSPLPFDDQEEALGRFDRVADWVATFEAELAREPWPEVLRAGVGQLVDGLFAAAAHGFLRVAHGVRALSRGDSPIFRRELAFGLGYWAARYQELPGRPGVDSTPGLRPAKVLRGLTPTPQARRKPGLFTQAVRALDGDRAFERAIESVDLDSAEPGVLLSELCSVVAQLYLENPGARVAYVHALTAPSALRLVAPRLDEETIRRGLGVAFQAAAAIHAVSAQSGGVVPDAETRRVSTDPAEIRYRAACSLEEHAIKFAEACLREDAIAPNPVFRLAAADAALNLGQSRGRSG